MVFIAAIVWLAKEHRREGAFEYVVCAPVFSQQGEYQREIDRGTVVPLVDLGYFGFDQLVKCPRVA